MPNWLTNGSRKGLPVARPDGGAHKNSKGERRFPMAWAARQVCAHTSLKMVLMQIASYADNQTGVAWPSMETLAEQCVLKDKQTRRLVKELERAGFISIDRSPGRKPNKYTLLMNQPSHGREGSESTNPPTYVPNPPTGDPEPSHGREGNYSELSKELHTLCDKAVEDWNLMAERTGLSQVQRMTEQRTEALGKRLTECGGLDGWRHACTVIEKSDYLTGGGPNGWRASFDWLIKPDTFAKIMEGAYSNAKRKSAREQSNDRLREWVKEQSGSD